METAYPPSPSDVPQGLTKASSVYKRRAWFALASLSLFIMVYFALTAWFVWTAYRLGLSISQGADLDLAAILTGAASAFMALFMAKALFFVKRSGESYDTEIKESDHPQLFKFFYQLADEAGAPRPHKVYLSSDVNAAVFYDLTLMNLLFPSKKNLIIGLGLINVLNLAEFKAVLAHEFGHFAQKSMAVGRWVYVAQQIAAQIIARRDMLDRFLQGLSRFDLRIAWVGWILSLIVWSIRSLLDSFFNIVVIAQRALSRQMEFQADLVAVSLTGSDSLVNALHKLGAADDAWSRALNFASTEAHEGRVVKDIFAIQSRIIEKLRVIYDDKEYGEAPVIPSDAADSHRVFKQQMASPPQMWSTHPENTAREENAKRYYIPSIDDNRSAWEVFENSDQVKEDMSAKLLMEVKGDKSELEETLANLDKKYSKPYLLPRFRGAYLGRAGVRHAAKPEELYEDIDVNALDEAAFKGLYPKELSEYFESLRGLYEEKHHLQAIKDRVYKVSGGIIYFRGKSIKRKHLKKAIGVVEADIQKLEEKIQEHDKRCRSLHIAAAKKVGTGWDAYLKGLTGLIHYADHTEADLRDVMAYMQNTIAVILADGKVSSGELKRLLHASEDAHRVLSRVFEFADKVSYDSNIAKRIDGEKNWVEYLGEYDFPPASQQNINDWVPAFESWVTHAAVSMSNLKLAALEVLLVAETKIAQSAMQDKPLGKAPSPATYPEGYRVLLPGKERPLQKKLDFWDSFQTATGFFPALARFVVATTIVGAVLIFGQSVGNSVISIYNGLQRTVVINVNGSEAVVKPNASVEMQVPAGNQYSVVATTKSGVLIEEFDKASQGYGAEHYIYNVSGAAPLYKWTAVYGNGYQPEDVYLGAPRWTSHSVDHYFEEPPESIKTEREGTRRTIISSLSSESPEYQFDELNEEQQIKLIETHARWDAANSQYLLFWLSYASRLESYPAILQARINESPEELIFLREEQILAGKDPASEPCVRHTNMANAKPDNADLAYLKIRCLTDSPEQDTEFLNASDQWPDHPWLAMAAGRVYEHKGQWDQARKKIRLASNEHAGLKAMLEIDLLRVTRAAKSEPSKSLPKTRQLKYYLAMESGRGTENSPYFAYSMLEKGDFGGALKQAEPDSSTYSRILRLVAASYNAPETVIQQALALPVDAGLDESSMWTAYALASRFNKSTEDFATLFEANAGPDDVKILAFFEAIRKGKRAEESERVLGEVAARQRGFAYAMAATFLQDKCPEKWKHEARSLLFASERPMI